MDLINVLRTGAKRKKMLTLCEILIQKYENSGTPSCKDELLHEIEEDLKVSAKELLSRNDSTNYEEFANSLILAKADDMLSTGRYNIYTGVISPMKCGQNLLRCFDHALQWGLDNGYYTEEVYLEQKRELRRRISEVG